MITFLRSLNLLQTLLFLAALIWFLFKIPDLTGNMVLIISGLLVAWLTVIAVLGKFIFDRDSKTPTHGSKQKLTVYEFMRRLQREPKG